jgi:hypothetical protein
LSSYISDFVNKYMYSLRFKIITQKLMYTYYVDMFQCVDTSIFGKLF